MQKTHCKGRVLWWTFREEYQTPEVKQKKKEFQYVSAWEYKGEPKDAELHKEELIYHNIEVKERSYK